MITASSDGGGGGAEKRLLATDSNELGTYLSQISRGILTLPTTPNPRRKTSSLIRCISDFGHEATDTRFAYAPVSQAHGHHHSVQCFALLHCSTDRFCTTPRGF